MSYRTVQEALSDPGLYCTSVAALLTDNLGVEWLNWEPETLEMELRVLGKEEPTPFLMDKAMAVSVLLSTNLFHISFETWNNIVQVLNFDRAKSDLFTPASIDDILWGTTEARILEGPDEFDNQGFSHDIARYVGTLLVQHGMTRPPSVLNFAEYNEDELDRRDIALSADEFVFKAYWDSHKNLIDDAEQEAISKTQLLLDQVKGLPLKNGSTEFLENMNNM